MFVQYSGIAPDGSLRPPAGTRHPSRFQPGTSLRQWGMPSNPLPRSADVFAASKRQFRLHLRPDDVLIERRGQRARPRAKPFSRPWDS
jgi:hypothetical protein